MIRRCRIADMCRSILLMVLIALPATAWPQGEAEEAAVAGILKAGGSVVRDDNLPGKPVVQVELTACQISPDAFERIRFLTQLRHLDL